MPTIEVSEETAASLKKQFGSEPTSSDVRIVILQRGWVAVGYYSEVGDDCKLENASVIRIWGTTKGLGEIAKNGPTESTALDAAGTIRFHKLTSIATLDCVRSVWLKHL